MALPNSNAAAVLDWTLEHEGGTFDHRGYVAHLKEGYVLSIHPEWTRVLNLDDVTPTQVSIYFHDYVQDEDTYIGTWVNDGKIHFDVVTVVEDFDEAVTLAADHGQDAIWSLEGGCEIFVEDVLDEWNREEEGDDFPEYLEWQDLPWGGDDQFDYSEDLWNEQ